MFDQQESQRRTCLDHNLKLVSLDYDQLFIGACGESVNSYDPGILKIAWLVFEIIDDFKIFLLLTNHTEYSFIVHLFSSWLYFYLWGLSVSVLPLGFPCDFYQLSHQRSLIWWTWQGNRKTWKKPMNCLFYFFSFSSEMSGHTHPYNHLKLCHFKLERPTQSH